MVEGRIGRTHHRLEGPVLREDRGVAVEDAVAGDFEPLGELLHQLEVDGLVLGFQPDQQGSLEELAARQHEQRRRHRELRRNRVDDGVVVDPQVDVGAVSAALPDPLRLGHQVGEPGRLVQRHVRLGLAAVQSTGGRRNGDGGGAPRQVARLLERGRLGRRNEQVRHLRRTC